MSTEEPEPRRWCSNSRSLSIGLRDTTIAPAFQAARINVNETLKTGARTSSGFGPRHAWRRAFVIGQVGLAFVLLLGMGLWAIDRRKKSVAERINIAFRGLTDRLRPSSKAM